MTTSVPAPTRGRPTASRTWASPWIAGASSHTSAVRVMPRIHAAGSAAAWKSALAVRGPTAAVSVPSAPGETRFSAESAC